MKTLASLMLLLSCGALSIALPSVAAEPVVATRAGTVEGRREAGIEVFRGLPFAAPPVGGLRWREPQAVQAWTGTRRADAHAASCVQLPGIPESAGGTAGPLSEDCLYLNVWTPGTGVADKRPVMVWIHGGALVYGSGNIALYDGAALARRGVVVVAINYRMGPLGFFSHPAIDGDRAGAPANYGLLDQLAALRWVRDNIAAFGGDPGNVTIFGESAGAQSVLALYASPLAKGLFHRGIAQSPYGIPGHARAKARETGIRVAAAVGADGADATAAQLRAIPAERFFETAREVPSLAPGFIIGDAALPRPILEAFQRGRQARLPLVIGSNSNEATVATAFGVDPAGLVAKLRAGKYLLKPLYPGVDDEAQLGRETVRDVVFTSFARRIASLHSKAAPTWRYYFSRVQQGLRAQAPGVAHGGEVPFVLDTGTGCGCLEVAFTDADTAYSREVGDYWLALAKSGAPRVAGQPDWPRDGARASRVMEFGERPVAREDFMKTRLDVFIGVLKTLDVMLGRK